MKPTDSRLRFRDAVDAFAVLAVLVTFVLPATVVIRHLPPYPFTFSQTVSGVLGWVVVTVVCRSVCTRGWSEAFSFRSLRLFPADVWELAGDARISFARRLSSPGAQRSSDPPAIDRTA